MSVVRVRAALLVLLAVLLPQDSGAAQEPVTVILQGPFPVRAPEEGAPPAGEPEPPRIGQRLRLEARVKVAPGFTAGSPRAEVDPGTFEVLGIEPGREDPQSRTYSLVVVPFQTGDLTFPGLAVDWAGPDGARGKSRSEPLPISVAATVADPEEATPADIRDPAALKVGRPAGWLVWGALLALLALLGLWWWWRRRKRAAAETAAPPPDPFEGLEAAEWALRALEGLQRGEVFQRRGAEAFHVRLAEIVRRYLEGQFGIEALEQTTLETLTSVEARLRPLPGPRNRLQRVLSACDLVKFARHRPELAPSLDLIGVARRWVEETRPVSEPGPETTSP
ncbi:MAG: hypothetical protein ACE5HD_04360 [Acidobacteriota bacterium]